MLVFTGARLSEVLELRWDWIDVERGEVRLPDSKTGAKTLHLPPPALAALSDLPRLDKNPFVIVGSNSDARLVNLEKPWRVIRAVATVRLWQAVGGDEVTALVGRLFVELKRVPKVDECRAEAKLLGIELPAAGLEDVRLHDLRHAFASVAASAGMGLPIIGKLLGHTQAQTTARYAHLAADPVKAAAAVIAERIEDAMKVAASAGSV